MNDWKKMLGLLAAKRLDEDSLEKKTSASDLGYGVRVAVVTKLGRTMATGVVQSVGDDFVELMTTHTGVDQLRRYATSLYDFMVSDVVEDENALQEGELELAIREAGGEWQKARFEAVDALLERAKLAWDGDDVELAVRGRLVEPERLTFTEDWNPEFVAFSPSQGAGVPDQGNPWASDATGPLPVTPSAMEPETRAGAKIVRGFFPGDHRYAEALWQDITTIGMSGACIRHGLPVQTQAEMTALLVAAGAISAGQ